MKKVLNKKVMLCIAILILIIIFIGFMIDTSFINRTNDISDTSDNMAKTNVSSNEDSEEDIIGCDGEYITEYNVSDNGAVISSYKSIPDSIIKAAKSYIKKKGIDSSDMSFTFCNSQYSYSPQYAVTEVVNVYNPKPLTKEYPEPFKKYLYYVMVRYENIGVGYFVINERGKITESNYIKTPEEISKYKREPDIGYNKACSLATKKLGSDEELEKNVKFFHYDSDGEGILWYRVVFSNGSEIYLNGITGEEEWSNKLKVSDEGATIWGQKSVPNVVVDGAKNYIKQKGMDSNELYFTFCNSQDYHDPEYVVEHVLDMYSPEPITFDSSEKDVYYVKITYKNADEENGILSGYFVINESGEVIESKHIKTADEISKYRRVPEFSWEKAFDSVKKENSDDEFPLLMSDGRFFDYNADGEGVLCYVVKYNGSKVYVNAITGEVVE